MVSGGVYVALVLAVTCVVLCVIILLQRGRQRRAEATNRQLSAAIDSIAELMREAEKTQSFSVRCENRHLVPCWTVLQCNNTECVAYENPDLRCWHLPGTLCPEPEGQNLFEKIMKCESCKVYQLARPDILTRLTEQFNNMLAMLQREAEQLAETKRHAQQASKLATIGKFAAGIAHEINNPLDGIMSCVARLERDPANLTQNMEYLKLIHDALKRMSVVVQHLLEYSQKHELQLESTDIHTVIEKVVALIGTSARQNAVDIEFKFDNAVSLTLGDTYYLEQAFLNLALNAMAATPEGGTVTFRTSMNGSVGGAGSFVEVDVIDTGLGIEPANLDKIFDPFFTTKEPGKGMGLGLAIVKSIIEDHQGKIVIESTPGAGTTVRVFLPVSGQDSLDTLVGEEVSGR